MRLLISLVQGGKHGMDGWMDGSINACTGRSWVNGFDTKHLNGISGVTLMTDLIGRIRVLWRLRSVKNISRVLECCSRNTAQARTVRVHDKPVVFFLSVSATAKVPPSISLFFSLPVVLFITVLPHFALCVCTSLFPLYSLSK